MTCVLYATIRCGSKWGGSQSRRDSVPPCFGLCPRAVLARSVWATAVVATIVPPALRKLRRLRSCCREMLALIGCSPPAELLQLGVAPDELRQPAPGGRLQARLRRARARHLGDLHGVG